MSDQAAKWQWLRSLRELTAVEFRVLFWLVDHAKQDTLHTWPAVATLITECECDRRSVQRALCGLRQRGLIAVWAQATQHRSTTYLLHVGRPGAAQMSGAAEMSPDPGAAACPPGAAQMSPGAAQMSSRGGSLPPEPLTEPLKNRKEPPIAHIRAREGEVFSEGSSPPTGEVLGGSQAGEQNHLGQERVSSGPAPQGRSGKGARATVASTRKKPATLEARVMALHAALPHDCDARAEDPDHFMTIARQINLSDDYRGPLEPKFETFVQFINRGFVAYNLVEVSGRWVTDHAEPARSSAAFAQVWARDAIHLDADGIYYVRGPNHERA
jgi:hypothetical protein